MTVDINDPSGSVIQSYNNLIEYTYRTFGVFVVTDKSIYKESEIGYLNKIFFKFSFLKND